VVVLPPLLTRKVGARLSLFCNVWRRRNCSEWVCSVLEVGFRLWFRECPPLTSTPSAFVDKGSIMKRTTLRSLIQSMQQMNVVEVGSPRHYISRVLPPPCSKEVRRLETSHRPLISQLLPRDSSLQDGECRKHSAISPSRCLGHFHRSCGCLFLYTHPQIRSFLLNQGGCAHTWQILLGHFTATEKLVPLGRLHTREAQHCISQHWDFNTLTSNLWIPLSPPAEEDLQWWKSAHNILRGTPVTLTEPDNQLFTDASNIGWGAHWNTLTVSGVWTTTEKTLHINVLELEAIHRAMLHWLRKLMGLTVVRQFHCSILHQQAGRNMVNTAVQTD